MDIDDLLENFWFILFIAVIIVFAIVAAYFLLNQPASEQGSPQLSFSLDTTSGKALEVVPLSLTISNNGDKANKVEVTLSSDAFGELTTQSIDVPAYGTKSTPSVDALIDDLPNKNYPVTITYTYEGMSETPSPTTEQFYVIPNMRLADVVYKRDFLYQEIDHIEQQGNTELYFKVESNSETSTYTHLSASLFCVQSGQNLVITPSENQVEDVGPQGKTENQYTFRIEGNNSPVGTYTLELVLSSDGHEVTTKTRTLYVK